MSFLERLEQIRGRSEAERRQWTFWVSAGLTALVAMVWVASLSFTLQTPTTSQVASVSAIKATSTGASVVESNKVKIIEGWKVITNQK